SNSWGFFGGASSSLDQAITDAATLGRSGKGTLFVVASGNENGPMRYPANTHPRVLAVGGISPCNQRKSPSSCDLEGWGASYGSNLDIVAPCVKIYTTDRTGSVGYSSGNYYPFFNGTSSATPNTAGVCALVFSIDSSLTWDSVRVRIDRTAEKVGNYVYNLPGPRNIGGWNNEMGYGKVNAYNVALYTQQHMGGSSGQLLTICRNGINKPIPDLGIVYDTISVNLGNTNLVIDANVKIDTVIHTWDNDLVFRLNRGSLTRTFINQAGGSGDNFIGTVLNDSAACVIGSSGCNIAPFTGSFRPFQPLTAFNGLNPTGNWILSIRDTAAADSGILKAWCLMITYVNTTGGISTITIPNKYSLKQNYPNPFNPVTKISYNLPEAGNVKLIVFDILGREVEILINEYKQAGEYTFEFNAHNYSSGVYFYKLEAGEFKDVKKMIIIK
ncbi:MAG: S8 family serine peptidase, partial [Ignavibacteria bacterium]